MKISVSIDNTPFQDIQVREYKSPFYSVFYFSLDKLHFNVYHNYDTSINTYTVGLSKFLVRGVILTDNDSVFLDKYGIGCQKLYEEIYKQYHLGIGVIEKIKRRDDLTKRNAKLKRIGFFD